MLKEHNWHQLKDDTAQRLNQLAPYFRDGKIIDAKDTVAALEAVIRSFDRVNIEGNNQKQADFLSECLCQLDPQKISGLHMVQSSVPLSSHLDLFEKGIAEKLDFAYAGPQDGRLAKLIQDGKIKLGAIHTYLELFSRYFVDLTPRVSLITAFEADKDGNLYTGFNTEDTPVITEATHFRQGIVIAQVNKIVDKVPRVDIPGDWVNAVIEAPRPFYVEPLFTRDPGLITDTHVLMAMMALKGIYAEYGVERINHGIGFFTAAIELLLPTYGEELGLKGKVCTHMLMMMLVFVLIIELSDKVEKNTDRIAENTREIKEVAGISFISARTARYAPTAPSPRLRVTTRWTCLSAALCRSISTETVAPPPPAAFRALAARRIWAAMPKAAVMQRNPG